jgi:hypothetical protein
MRSIRSSIRIAPLVTVLACLPLLPGCAAAPQETQAVAAAHQGHDQGSGQGHTVTSQVQALPQSVEQLSSAIGCPEPDMQVEATELRQAVCQAPKGRYTVATFTTDKGQRDWLDEAQAYGGTYLVGPRWVVIAEPALLEDLQGGVGGAIEATQHH